MSSFRTEPFKLASGEELPPPQMRSKRFSCRSNILHLCSGIWRKCSPASAGSTAGLRQRRLSCGSGPVPVDPLYIFSSGRCRRVLVAWCPPPAATALFLSSILPHFPPPALPPPALPPGQPPGRSGLGLQNICFSLEKWAGFWPHVTCRSVRLQSLDKAAEASNLFQQESKQASSKAPPGRMRSSFGGWQGDAELSK